MVLKNKHHGFESRLTEKLKKSKGTRHDEKSTLIIRKFSRLLDNWIASKLVSTSITPNQITFLSFIVILISAFFFVLGKHIYVILGALLFLLSHILDGVDGSLARLKGMSSTYGDFLDSVVGVSSRPIVFFCMAVGVYLRNHDPWVWIFVYSAMTSMLVKHYIQYSFMKSFEFSKKVSEEAYNKMKFLMLFRCNVWFYLPVLLLLAAFDQVYAFLIFFGLYAPAYAIAQTILLLNKAKKSTQGGTKD